MFKTVFFACLLNLKAIKRKGFDPLVFYIKSGGTYNNALPLFKKRNFYFLLPKKFNAIIVTWYRVV